MEPAAGQEQQPSSLGQREPDFSTLSQSWDDEKRTPDRDLRWPEIYAFVGSASLLVLELVAGRLLAPVLGVTLYTWTSIIGVVLAGLTVGNLIGGAIADRWPRRHALGLLYLGAAATSSLTLILFDHLGAIPQFPSAGPVNIIWLTAVLFFLPGVFLGATTPMLVKLSLNSVNRAGRVTGRIQGLAAAGSICGTFATGFLFISWFGTRQTILGVALVLFLLATAAGRWRYRGAGILGLAVSLLGAAAWSVPGSACELESNYYCIRTTHTEGTTYLFLDNLVHGAINTEQPDRLVLTYAQLATEFISESFVQGTPMSALVIGGGSYTLPRFLDEHFSADVLVAEIDPSVTAVAAAEFSLPDTTSIETRNTDGRILVNELAASRKFDVVINDAFSEQATAFHLTTQEFHRTISAHLTQEGVYISNVIDGGDHQLVRSLLKTLRTTFTHVGALTKGGVWPPYGVQNVIIVASDRPLSESSSKVGDEAVRQFEEMGEGVFLTDNHAPVDQLIWSPVYD